VRAAMMPIADIAPPTHQASAEPMTDWPVIITTTCARTCSSEPNASYACSTSAHAPDSVPHAPEPAPGRAGPDRLHRLR